MAFDQLLKRHFWVVVLGLTAGVAYLNAQGVTQVVGSGLGADEKELAAAPLTWKMAPAIASVGDHVTSADAILSRNPFDSITGPLIGQSITLPELDAGSVAAGPRELDDPEKAPICEGVKVLIIAASSDPDWSFAAFSGAGTEKRNILRRRGGEVNGKTVKFIGWDTVWLASEQHALCQAKMFAPPPPPAPSASHAVPVPSGGASSLSSDIAKGISKKSDKEFDVDRGVVDKILENQAELMRQARIMPEQENGKVVGIRLYGVRPDTLLGVLGMENGDRLEKINGFDMTSPEKALEAYARLRTADHLTISLNRRGAATNIDYNIK